MTQFVRKAMAIRPENRFQNVKAMRTALDKRLFKLRQQSRSSSTSHRVQQTVKRQPQRRSSKPRQEAIKVKRYLDEYAPKLAPVVTPMLKPITVVGGLFAFVTVIGPLPAVARFAVWPSGGEWLVLLGVGVATQFAQICLTRGLSLVPAGRAMTVAYTQILFAALWGALFFAEYPDGWTVVGALLVIIGAAAVSLRDRAALSAPTQGG